MCRKMRLNVPRLRELRGQVYSCFARSVQNAHPDLCGPYGNQLGLNPSGPGLGNNSKVNFGRLS